MEPIVLGLVPQERYLKVWLTRLVKFLEQRFYVKIQTYKFLFHCDILGLLLMWTTRPRKPSLLWSMHAMQQIRLQTKLPRHLRTKSRVAVRRSWKLHGQCQILWLLWISLPENCEYLIIYNWTCIRGIFQVSIIRWYKKYNFIFIPFTRTRNL